MKSGAIIAAILFLAGAVLWLSSRPESASQRMPELVRFDPASIDSITLGGGGVEELELKRAGDFWLMPDQQKADSSAVQHLLDDLATMEIVRVVTRNPENYSDLGIGKDSVRVALSAGGRELPGIEIGKQGSDLISTYLRIGDMPEVLAVNRTLLWQVRRAKDGWRAVEQKGTSQSVQEKGKP